MDVNVLKFGGTSVAGAASLERVAAIVGRAAARARLVVVVSAQSGVTDALIAAVTQAERRSALPDPLVGAILARHRGTLARLAPGERGRDLAGALEARGADLMRRLQAVRRTGRCADAERAEIVAAGERCSALLTTAALRAAGLAAEPVDAAELIVADPGADDPPVDGDATRRATRARLGRVRPGAIPVVTGFVAGDGRGRTLLLGRGGSDWSAGLLAAAVGAARVEIWTDVPGVLSAPPRLVPAARTVPVLPAREATALARWGGKVLHPRTLEPLAGTAVSVVVASTFAPDGPATTVVPAGLPERPRVVSVRDGFSLLTAPAAGAGAPESLARRLRTHGFDAWPARGLPGAPGGGVLVRSAAAEAAARFASGAGIAVTPRDEVGVVAVIGARTLAPDEGRGGASAALARLPLLATLADLAGVGVGLVVRAHHLRRAANLLHGALGLGDEAAPAPYLRPLPGLGQAAEVRP